MATGPDAIAAIGDVLGQPRSGGTDIEQALLSSFALIREEGQRDPDLARAQIVLVTDELCRVAARVEGTKEKGIISGERGALGVARELRLRFLSRNAEVAPGMNIVSSGDGGVFPANLLIGRVKIFENKDISGEAVIEPAVDFAKLEDVFVIGVDPSVQASAK